MTHLTPFDPTVRQIFYPKVEATDRRTSDVPISIWEHTPLSGAPESHFAGEHRFIVFLADHQRLGTMSILPYSGKY